MRWESSDNECHNEVNEILDADYITEHGCDAVDLAVLDFDLPYKVKNESRVGVLRIVTVCPNRDRLFRHVEVGEFLWSRPKLEQLIHKTDSVLKKVYSSHRLPFKVKLFNVLQLYSRLNWRAPGMVHLVKVNEIEQRLDEEGMGCKEILYLVLTSTGLTWGQLRVLPAP